MFHVLTFCQVLLKHTIASIDGFDTSSMSFPWSKVFMAKAARCHFTLDTLSASPVSPKISKAKKLSIQAQHSTATTTSMLPPSPAAAPSLPPREQPRCAVLFRVESQQPTSIMICLPSATLLHPPGARRLPAKARLH